MRKAINNGDIIIVSNLEYIGDLPQFCYDNGSDPELAKLPHCPAVDAHGNRTGVQCINCRHCYNAKRGQRWSIYAH